MTRSNRTTGQCRRYRGSGCVGLIPMSNPGNPAKERRKTKPPAKGRHAGPHYHESVLRGRRLQQAVIARAFQISVRPNRLAAAVRSAIGRKG